MIYLFLFLVIAVCGCQSGPQTRLNGKFEQGIISKAIEVKTPKNHRDSVLFTIPIKDDGSFSWTGSLPEETMLVLDLDKDYISIPWYAESQDYTLEKAGENFKKVLNRSKDITEVAEADVRFHDVIYMATDNQKLIHLLNKLREQMYRYRVEYLKNPDVHEQLIQEHEEIVYHIKRREKAEATAVTCQHIDNQVSAVTDKIRTKNN